MFSIVVSFYFGRKQILVNLFLNEMLIGVSLIFLLFYTYAFRAKMQTFFYMQVLWLKQLFLMLFLSHNFTVTSFPLLDISLFFLFIFFFS